VAAAINDERKKGTLERLITTHLTVGEFSSASSGERLPRFNPDLYPAGVSYRGIPDFHAAFVPGIDAVRLLFATACSSIGLLIPSIARTGEASTWVGFFHDDDDDAWRNVLHDFQRLPWL